MHGNDKQQGQPDRLGDRWEDSGVNSTYCNSEQRTDTSRWLPWKAPCPLGMLLIQPSPCTYNFSGIKREMGQLRALTSEGFGLPATLM